MYRTITSTRTVLPGKIIGFPTTIPASCKKYEKNRTASCSQTQQNGQVSFYFEIWTLCRLPFRQMDICRSMHHAWIGGGTRWNLLGFYAISFFQLDLIGVKLQTPGWSYINNFFFISWISLVVQNEIFLVFRLRDALSQKIVTRIAQFWEIEVLFEPAKSKILKSKGFAIAGRAVSFNIPIRTFQRPCFFAFMTVFEFFRLGLERKWKKKKRSFVSLRSCFLPLVSFLDEEFTCIRLSSSKKRVHQG